MNWRHKSLAFRALAAMPLGHRLHYAAQRYVTREWPRPADHIEAYKLRATQFISAMRSFSALPPSDVSFVEVGAGRDLALAIALRLAGAGPITCIDIQRIAKLPLIRHAQRVLGATESRSWHSLERSGIVYMAPAGVETAPISAGSVGCFFSSEVFEHIPHPSLEAVLNGAHRYLHADGVMIHAIDYSDHFARSDAAISRYNFLRFSDADWERHNSTFQYVNRLRHSQYLTLFKDAGFEVISAEPVHGQMPDEVRRELAPQFRAFSPEDLSILSSIIIARKARAATNIHRAA